MPNNSDVRYSKGDGLFFRFVRASVIGAAFMGGYLLMQPRESIPDHLSSHTVLSIPNLISEVELLSCSCCM